MLSFPVLSAWRIAAWVSRLIVVNYLSPQEEAGNVLMFSSLTKKRRTRRGSLLLAMASVGLLCS
eukprot:scaffold3043_cov121-Cylindrotheca_fusiformis.AAC.12